jgi:hypothetical protein
LAAALVAIEVDTMAWGEANLHPTLQWLRKRLVSDTAAQGTYVSLLRYRAGVINPSQTHPHPHGFTEVIHHGAGAKEEMVAVFMSGAPFKMDYVNK